MFNNTTHRPATIQRLRIAAEPDGRITAMGWRPKTSLRDGLAAAYAWFLENAKEAA